MADKSTEMVDLSYVVEGGASVEIVTGKDEAGLEVIRHSTAHLLAQAVKALYPSAQVTIGPVVENGFYYDFAFERPFTPEDLKAIEKKMAELAARLFRSSAGGASGRCDQIFRDSTSTIRLK